MLFLSLKWTRLCNWVASMKAHIQVYCYKYIAWSLYQCNNNIINLLKLLMRHSIRNIRAFVNLTVIPEVSCHTLIRDQSSSWRWLHYCSSQIINHHRRSILSHFLNPEVCMQFFIKNCKLVLFIIWLQFYLWCASPKECHQKELIIWSSLAAPFYLVSEHSSSSSDHHSHPRNQISSTWLKAMTMRHQILPTIQELLHLSNQPIKICWKQ